MLFEIKSLEPYQNFIRETAADENYSDPHFLYNENNLFGAFKKKNQKVFASQINGKTEGIFVFLIIPEESYMEMIIGLSKSENAYVELFSYLESQYPGYQRDFVINPKNKIVSKILKSKNAVFETEQQKMVWTTKKERKSNCQILEYSPEWKEPYCTLHRKGGYWTAEKVLEADEKFRIFLAVKDTELVGYLDVTYCFAENEPYDLFVRDEYRKRGYEEALLQKALQLNVPKKMMVLVDVDASEEIARYEAVGFEKVKGQNSVYVTCK